MRSRVTPGISCTTAFRDEVSRLISVDFPALGKPTTATVPASTCDSGSASPEDFGLVAHEIAVPQPRGSAPAARRPSHGTHRPAGARPSRRPAAHRTRSVRAGPGATPRVPSDGHGDRRRRLDDRDPAGAGLGIGQLRLAVSLQEDGHDVAVGEGVVHRAEHVAVGLVAAHRERPALAQEPADRPVLEQLRLGHEAHRPRRGVADQRDVPPGLVVGDEQQRAGRRQPIAPLHLRPKQHPHQRSRQGAQPPPHPVVFAFGAHTRSRASSTIRSATWEAFMPPVSISTASGAGADCSESRLSRSTIACSICSTGSRT